MVKFSTWLEQYIKNKLKMKAILLSIFIILLLVGFVNATEFTSSSYKVLDPVIDVASGPRAATTSFTLLTAVGQPAIGRSTSDTYNLLSGFLYFFEPASAPPPTPPPPPPPPPFGGGPIFPPITYFPPIIPLFPPIAIPPIIPPLIPSLPPLIPPFIPEGCVPGENGIPRADLNCDGNVNLVDFSVFMYFLPRPIEISRLADITKDKIIDLVDLSVMFSEWTERAVSFVNGGDAPGVSDKEERAGGLEKLKDVFAKGKDILERAEDVFSEEKYESIAGGAGVSGRDGVLTTTAGKTWSVWVFLALVIMAILSIVVGYKLKIKS